MSQTQGTTSSLEAEVFMLRLEAEALAQRNAELRYRLEMFSSDAAVPCARWSSAVTTTTAAEEWVAPEPYASKQLRDATTQTATSSPFVGNDGEDGVDGTSSAAVIRLPTCTSSPNTMPPGAKESDGPAAALPSPLQHVLSGLHHLTLQVLFLAAELVPASSAELLQTLQVPRLPSEDKSLFPGQCGNREALEHCATALREHTGAVARLEAALRAKLCALTIVAKESDEALTSHVSECSPRLAELEDACRSLRAECEHKDASLAEVSKALESTTTMILQAHETIAEKERMEHELRKTLRHLNEAQEGGQRELDELRRENASLNLALERVQRHWLGTTNSDLHPFGRSDHADGALPDEAFPNIVQPPSPSPGAGLPGYGGGTAVTPGGRAYLPATESVPMTHTRSALQHDPATARRFIRQSGSLAREMSSRRRGDDGEGDHAFHVTSPPARVPIDVKLDALTRSIFERAMNNLE